MPTTNDPATPRLNLPEDRRVTACKKVFALVLADGKLAALQPVIKIPIDPTFGDAPPQDRVWLRFTPHFGDMTPYGQDGSGGIVHRAPVVIQVEIKCPGFLWENAANVWARLQELLSPRHMQPAKRLAFGAALAAAGASEVYFVHALFRKDDTNPDQIGTGQIQLVCYV